MKRSSYVGTVFLSIGFLSCQHWVEPIDTRPPSPPQGVSTVTGDHQIEIFWYDSPEPDVAGYNVFVSNSFAGKYMLIGSTGKSHFIDLSARNGYTYYYAVSAYDYNGNESQLSRDVAYDTPRPEGYDVTVKDYRRYPNSAGYDFSTTSVGPYDDLYTDVFFEYYGGEYYLNVWDDSEIQDMGYTRSLYEVGFAPEAGWSPTKDVRVIPGHTYAVRTWDNHYAKIRVIGLASTGLRFDWAYQLQSGNPRLKQIGSEERGELKSGSGMIARK